MVAIPFNGEPERELSLPFVCQCDLCMKQNVYSLYLATIKRQIQIFGVESVRRVA